MIESITNTLAQQNYVASSDDVKALARAVVRGGQASTDYMKVLLVECQSRLGKGRRAPSVETQLQVLHDAADKFYPAVLEGINEEQPNITPKERNSLSNFARTAKAEIRKYIEAGLDVRLVDPTMVTKRGIRQAAVAPPGTAQPNAPSNASAEALLRTVKRAERMMANALKALVDISEDMAEQAANDILTAIDKIVPLEDHSLGESTIITKAPTQWHRQPNPAAQLHRSA